MPQSNALTQALNDIVRDACECERPEKYDVDTVELRVSDLRLIVDRHLSALSQPSPAVPIGYIPADVLPQLAPPRLILKQVPICTYEGEGTIPIYAAPQPTEPAQPPTPARARKVCHKCDGDGLTHAVHCERYDQQVAADTMRAWRDGYNTGKNEPVQPSTQAGAGWRLVPVEPTYGMISAGRVNLNYASATAKEIWAGMLAAAPTTQQPNDAPQQGAAALDIAKTCDGLEQEAWEAWAAREGLVMSQHPLHYLFLNPKTDAARKAWKAGLRYASGRVEASLATPQPQPAEQVAERSMADALAAGDGGLHAAIDYWQDRALRAEKRLPAGSHLCAFNPGCSSRCDVCPEDIHPAQPATQGEKT